MFDDLDEDDARPAPGIRLFDDLDDDKPAPGIKLLALRLFDDEYNKLWGRLESAFARERLREQAGKSRGAAGRVRLREQAAGGSFHITFGTGRR